MYLSGVAQFSHQLNSGKRTIEDGDGDGDIGVERTWLTEIDKAAVYLFRVVQGLGAMFIAKMWGCLRAMYMR